MAVTHTGHGKAVECGEHGFPVCTPPHKGRQLASRGQQKDSGRRRGMPARESAPAMLTFHQPATPWPPDWRASTSDVSVRHEGFRPADRRYRNARIAARGSRPVSLGCVEMLYKNDPQASRETLQPADTKEPYSLAQFLLFTWCTVAEEQRACPTSTRARRRMNASAARDSGSAILVTHLHEPKGWAWP